MSPRNYSVHKSRPVRQHDQDDPNWCGRACVQMIVGSLSSSPSPNTPLVSQADIKAQEGPYPDPDPQGWYATPQDMVTALNSGRIGLPVEFSRDWRISQWATEEDLLADIAMSMEVYHTPAAVSYFSGEHWKVVVEVSVFPTLIEVWAMDPRNPNTRCRPRQHTYLDSCQKNAGPVGGDAMEVFESVIQDPSSSLYNQAVGVVFGRETDVTGKGRQALAREFKDIEGRPSRKIVLRTARR